MTGKELTSRVFRPDRRVLIGVFGAHSRRSAAFRGLSWASWTLRTDARPQDARPGCGAHVLRSRMPRQHCVRRTAAGAQQSASTMNVRDAALQRRVSKADHSQAARIDVAARSGGLRARLGACRCVSRLGLGAAGVNQSVSLASHGLLEHITLHGRNQPDTALERRVRTHVLGGDVAARDWTVRTAPAVARSEAQPARSRPNQGSRAQRWWLPWSSCTKRGSTAVSRSRAPSHWFAPSRVAASAGAAD